MFKMLSQNETEHTKEGEAVMPATHLIAPK